MTHTKHSHTLCIFIAALLVSGCSDAESVDPFPYDVDVSIEDAGAPDAQPAEGPVHVSDDKDAG